MSESQWVLGWPCRGAHDPQEVPYHYIVVGTWIDPERGLMCALVDRNSGETNALPFVQLAMDPTWARRPWGD